MKRTAVTLTIAIATLTFPAAANAGGIVQNGLGSSPGSVRPMTGVIQSGFGTSPGLARPLPVVVVRGLRTSPRAVSPHIWRVIQPRDVI